MRACTSEPAFCRNGVSSQPPRPNVRPKLHQIKATEDVDLLHLDEAIAAEGRHAADRYLLHGGQHLALHFAAADWIETEHGTGRGDGVNERCLPGNRRRESSTCAAPSSFSIATRRSLRMMLTRRIASALQILISIWPKLGAEAFARGLFDFPYGPGLQVQRQPVDPVPRVDKRRSAHGRQ
jgi:hypothetical protein